MLGDEGKGATRSAAKDKGGSGPISRDPDVTLDLKIGAGVPKSRMSTPDATTGIDLPFRPAPFG
ncbi:MAG: hypothetical protein ABIQ29_06500, partial [Burkholderiaceae bacterium]